MRTSVSLGLFIAATISTAAEAQDFYSPMPSVGAMMFPVVMNPCPGGKCAANGKSSSPRTASPNVTTDGETSLVYRPTEVSLRAAEQEYLNRLQQNRPDAVQGLSEQMRAHDFGSIYGNIVAPFGLRRGDVGDASAAYTLLGWMIANGATDPTPAQVHALRANIGKNLAAEARITDPTSRTALGEELVISFVALHAGWQSARREGQLREYSDGVAMMFQRQGTDLRALRLTDQGLVGR